MRQALAGGDVEGITRLLDAARGGDADARERLFAAIYSELSQLAQRKLSRQSQLTMLDAPGLVHEVYLRLAQQPDLPGGDRRAFLAYASRIMRSVIVDYVRARNAERRGGDRERITLHTGVQGATFDEPDIEALGDALESFSRIDERAHWIVEMRYFGGMELEEIADFLKISVATVKRDWSKARAYLMHALRAPAGAT